MPSMIPEIKQNTLLKKSRKKGKIPFKCKTMLHTCKTNATKSIKQKSKQIQIFLSTEIFLF